jgi:hyperosmotically inducible periplasmic protein
MEANMLRRYLKGFSMAAVLIFLMSLVPVGMASVSKQTTPSSSGIQPKNLQDRIQHSLLMLPYYDVFDQIGYKIQGDTVTLVGEVKRPLLKDEAEQAVRKLTGVTKVMNDIEILPLSSMDDSLRLMTFRAIYSRPGFEKYGLQAVKPIRIIVKNGNVTLVGVVASEFDKIEAEMAARSVPFAFSIKNELTIG